MGFDIGINDVLQGAGLALTAGAAGYQLFNQPAVAGETPAARVAAQAVADQFKLYLKDIKPHEQAYIADLMKPTEQKEAAARGMTNADMQQALAKQTAGVNPNKMTATGQAMAKAAQPIANGLNQAGLNVQAKKAQALNTMAGMGNQQLSAAMSGMNSVAAAEQAKAVAAAQAQNARTAGTLNTIGSLGGAITGLAKNVDFSKWFGGGAGGTTDINDPSRYVQSDSWSTDWIPTTSYGDQGFVPGFDYEQAYYDVNPDGTFWDH